MNAFVKKEIRLLLPSWIVVLLLAALLPLLFWNAPDDAFSSMPLFLFFGMVILAVDSFGREFSAGTFSPLMSQPMERRQIWRTKIAILIFATALIAIVYFIGSEFLFHRALKISIWSGSKLGDVIVAGNFRNAMINSGVALLIALTGGLWTTLLLRQIAAAFWITFLVPLGILMAIMLFMPEKVPVNIVSTLLYILAGIYSVAGFWFAHRQFHRAQDAAWTGGVINFSTWRYFAAGDTNYVSRRGQKPLSALLKKEFQLHSLSLLCTGALLVLHISIFFLRAFEGQHIRQDPDSLVSTVSEFFWSLWLIMPLAIGCMAVAEERKLSLMDGQFCLPVSRRRQFAFKFIPVLFSGVLLGGVMPLALEKAAAISGVPNDYFKPDNHMGTTVFSGLTWFYFCVIASSAGLAMLGLLASTLAKNFMQALSIAIAGMVACSLFETLLTSGHFFADHGNFKIIGQQLWGVGLPILVGMATIVTFVPWLAWRNYSYFVEGGRLWRRNIFGIIGSILFVFAASTMIYNRAWEFLEPAEPAHGAAKISLSSPAILQSDARNSLQVHLPDGRVWFDSLSDFEWYEQPGSLRELWQRLVPPLPASVGPQAFMSGSNWVSTTIARRENFWDNNVYTFIYPDTVGIRLDGSLWVSGPAKPGVWTGTNMIRYGNDNDWRQVASVQGLAFLLLKDDGTLWWWQNREYDWNNWRNRHTDWPSVRTIQPLQISTNSNWREIFSTWDGFARKTDGSTWAVDFARTNGIPGLARETNLDLVVPQTYSGNGMAVYLNRNGTLWITGRVQLGTETNWVKAAENWSGLVTLKSDGSLWQWDFNNPKNQGIGVDKVLPTRLGIHTDWVGLTATWNGIISLAADGSLWFWPGQEYDGALLKATRKPQFLANIFSQGD